jgi:hypothetical protein
MCYLDKFAFSRTAIEIAVFFRLYAYNKQTAERILVNFYIFYRAVG